MPRRPTLAVLLPESRRALLGLLAGVVAFLAHTVVVGAVVSVLVA